MASKEKTFASFVRYDPKFSQSAYERYKNNYALLNQNINNADNLNSALTTFNATVSGVNNDTSGKKITIYDKYLATGAFDNSMNIINNTNYDNKLSSNIVRQIHDYRLENIKNDVNKLYDISGTPINAANPPVSPPMAYKSYDTSQILNIEGKRNEPTNNPNRFIIYANDGCLQYNPAAVNETDRLTIAPCRANEQSGQLFTSSKIDDIDKYNSFFDEKSLYRLNSNDIYQTGFYVVNPAADINKSNKDKNCLTFSESGLGVKPCDMSVSQKFSALNEHVI